MLSALKKKGNNQVWPKLQKPYHYDKYSYTSLFCLQLLSEVVAQFFNSVIVLNRCLSKIQMKQTMPRRK